MTRSVLIAFAEFTELADLAEFAELAKELAVKLQTRHRYTSKRYTKECIWLTVARLRLIGTKIPLLSSVSVFESRIQYQSISS